MYCKKVHVNIFLGYTNNRQRVFTNEKDIHPQNQDSALKPSN